MSSPLAVLRRLRPPADADALTAYAITRDPLLLAELVRRHGGLVWGVCRRALPHRPDAEDAYQATWLVLVANPGAVRSPAALPAFLHTVAVRASRRVRQKRPLTVDADHLPARESADREALVALDAELGRLPDALRQPLVSCYLDGRTQDEAAKELGLSLSTLKRRLESGKELLRARLAGRGIDAAAVLTAAGLTGVGAPAVVAGGAGVAATALSTEVLSAMWMLKAKGWAAGLVLAAGLTATGGGLMLAGGQGPGGGPAPMAKLADPPATPPTQVPTPPVAPAGPLPAPPTDADVEKVLRAQLDTLRRFVELDEEIRKQGAIPREEQAAFLLNLLQSHRQMLTIRLRLAHTPVERRTAAGEAVAKAREIEKLATAQVEQGLAREQALLQVRALRQEVEAVMAAEAVPTVAVSAVPARLLKERRRSAERFIDLDKQIREVGAISKEEASAFEMNVSRAAQELYEATGAEFPTPAYRLAAAHQWYVTARDVERFYRARADRGLNREQVALSAFNARVRAEIALFQAAALAPLNEVRKLRPVEAAVAGYTGTVAKVADDWVTIKPADGLTTLHVLRVSRGGKPVGSVLVVVSPGLYAPRQEGKRAAPPPDPDEAGQALVIALPNPDGTIPAVQVGDDVRP